jgi:hypothetical protein
MTIEALNLPLTDVIFTHVHTDGTNVHIASTRLHHWCLENSNNLEIASVPVEPKHARHFVDDNIVTLDRVQELVNRGFNSLVIPVILCAEDYSDRPDVLFVDGHHRYVAHYMLHVPQILAFLLRPCEWHPFRVDGLPSVTHKELLASPNIKRHY